MCNWFTPSDSDNQSGEEYNAQYNATQQAMAPKPLPASMLSPQPTDVSPQQTAEQRRNRLNALKFGAMSTIRTSPMGVTGAGPDLQTPTAKGAKATIGS